MDRRKRYLKRVGNASAVLLLNEEDAERYHPDAILLDEETHTDDDSDISENDSSLTENSEETIDEEPPAKEPAPKKTTRKK